MDHPLLVGNLQSAAQLLADGQHHGDRQRAPALDEVLERLPLHELHRDEVEPVHLAEVVGPDDVAVGDLPRQPDLLLEPLQRRRLRLRCIHSQRLDRDQLAQLLVPGAVHDPHPAHAEHALDLVPAGERGARRQHPRFRLHLTRDGGRCDAAHRGVHRPRNLVGGGAHHLDQLLLRLQLLDHVLERRRQLADLVPARDFDLRLVVALGHAPGHADQRAHRTADHAPHQPGTRQRERQPDEPRQHEGALGPVERRQLLIARAERQIAAQGVAAPLVLERPRQADQVLAAQRRLGSLRVCAALSQPGDRGHHDLLQLGRPRHRARHDDRLVVPVEQVEDDLGA